LLGRRIGSGLRHTVAWSAAQGRASVDSRSVGTRKRRDPAVATLLSFAWPGLGQAYRGAPRRAAVFALPPLAAVVVLVALVVRLGVPVFAAYLAVPQWSAVAITLVIAAALWWAWAILDAGRPPSRASRVASLALLSLVILGAGWAGSVVWSLYQAGERIGQPGSTASPTPGQSTPGGTAGPTPRPTPSPSPTPDLTGRVTVLLLGWDLGRGIEGQLTDTIQVASFDPATGHIAVISLPRDTGQLPLYSGGTWPQKINALMAYAERHPDEFPDGGLGTLERQLEYIIGIPIDYYAAVDFAGFEQLVDLVGGVDVTLDRPIADDTYGWGPNRPRGFFLEPGDHHLDGRTALAYVRSRHGPGNSDWQRARRQQQVLLELRHKIEDPRVLARLPELVDAVSRMVRTNAPIGQVPQIVSILQASTAADADTVVLRPREYAEVVPRSEIGQVYMTRLKMDAVADLSVRLFGESSRYYQP
jgi:LCP family protein required for cell wall assembly